MNKHNFWVEGENAYISLYDDFSKNLKTKEEVLFYKSLFRRKQILIEFGCGTGRVLLPLLKDGYRIDGLDISREMLKKLGIKLKKDKLRAKIFNMDLCSFASKQKYDGALLSQRTLNFITDADLQLKALVNIGRALKKGAKLVINLMPANPGKFASVQKTLVRTGRFMNSKTGKMVELWENWIPHPVEQIWESVNEFREGKMRCRGKMHMRAIFLPEIKFMLELSGFNTDKVYGSWKKEPFGLVSSDLIIVAQKR